jgi:internalin A
MFLRYLVLTAAVVGCGGKGSHGRAPETGAGGDSGNGVEPPQACSLSENPELAAELARFLSLQPGSMPTPEQLSTVMGLSTRGLKSLGGVECLPKLGTLTLVDATVTDLSPLAELQSLHELSFSESTAPVLTSMGAASARLSTLTIKASAYSELSSLAAFTSLTTLNLTGNGIVSLDALPALPELKKLVLDGNALDDLSQLQALSALEELSVRDNALVSLADLNGHPGLRYLTADRNQIASLEDLELSALTGLELAENLIESPGSLKGISNLVAFGLASNPLQRLTGLADAPRLRRLALASSPLEELGELATLNALEELDLGQTAVQDLSPLAALTTIKSLRLEGSEITDLEPLRDWTNLEGSCRSVLGANLALSEASLAVADGLCRAGWEVTPVCAGAPCVPHQ